MKLMAANETKESLISIVDYEASVRDSLGRQRGSPTVNISGHASENEQTGAMMRGAVAFHSEMPGDQVCPLCRETAPIGEIPGRFVREHADLHASTVKMVKTLNPEWAEQDGLCQRCWRFYVGLGRVVNFLRSPDAPPKDANWESNSTAAVRQKE